MPAKLKPACPKCGSFGVSRDATVRWVEPALGWRLSGIFDRLTCDDCGHETDDGPKWAAPKKLPVLFRFLRSVVPAEREVVAVFPTLPGSPGLMACYARVGQHSSCSMEWFRATRPAEANDFAELHRELAQIYSDTELVVVKRILPAMRDARREAERRAGA